MAADATAGSETEAAPDAQGAKPRGKKKMIIVTAAVLLLIGGGGGGAYFAGLFGHGEAAPDPAAAIAGTAEPPYEPTFWSAPDIVVSLNTSDRKMRYLKLRTSLELSSPADVAAIEKLAPRIIDFCQMYLRELRPEEVRGSVALVRLREEMLRRINLAVAPVVVRDVLFSDIFME